VAPSSLLPNLQHPRVHDEFFQLPRERRLNLLALTSLIFFTTCGGPFGLEPLVGAVGAGWAIVLILVTPFVWSLPAALMAAELTALMPEEGGYYVWVREAFGSFCAVQQAWWMMIVSAVWLAMFPVLFVSYFSFFFPALEPPATASHADIAALTRWILAVLFITAGVALNLRGAREVGNSAKVSAYFVLATLVVLFLAWLKFGPVPTSLVDFIRRDLTSNHKGVVLLGLSYIVFNMSGWENASTYAGEVDQPQHNYPRALAFALLVLILCYLLPVIAGVSTTSDPAIWSSDAGWPVIGQLIGGRWLGGLLAAAGLISTMGLFNAQLLYVSRLPFVLARDGWFPRFLGKASPGTAVPKAALLSFAAITALFASLSFGSLAIIQCLLYAGSLSFEFLALLALRFRRPSVNRSFRVPGGWLGLSYVCVTPFAFATLVLFATLRDWRSFPGQLFVVGGVLVSGVVLYFARRRFTSQRSDERVVDSLAKPDGMTFTR
jgi:amino acid transporter